mgnify:CR=1 FL=1
MKYALYCLFLLLSINVCSQNIWFENRHSTDANDAWHSCTPSANPNSARGSSHWIMYDLGYIYTLTTSRIWNYNAPNHLNRGIQNAVIDISTDGTNWTVLGNFVFPQANASGFYEGFTGPDFGSVQARYVIITALSNYGGSCYGLGEIKIDVVNSPLPVSLLTIEVLCKDKPELHWSTASEINNDYFEIQYSKDGTEWQDYVKVKGAGSTQKRTDYVQKIDISPDKINYARLVQTDLDGKKQILPVVKVDCRSAFSSLSLYPNPAVHQIQIQTSEISISEYRIMANDGRLVKSGFVSETGIISISELKPGTYFIGMNAGDGWIYKEFVKL